MQQVNLYQPILRKQQKIFTARTLLQGNLVVLLGLLLLYGYGLLQSHNMRTQLAEVQQQRSEQGRQLTELTQRYPVKQKDVGIRGRIEQAQAELQHKQKLLTAVGELGLDSGTGFSLHLTGLARQDMPQLWLRQITLQQGRQVVLLGSAYQAEQVPRYLQRLAEEEAFRGTTFRSVLINRSEERPGRVDFSLSTIEPKGETKR